MEAFSIVYIMNDQLTTCPFCGARSDITLEVANSEECRQYHRCLNPKCQFEFIMEQDLEMYEKWSKPMDKR